VKPTAVRQQAFRDRRKADGLIRCEVFAHPDDHERIKRYVKKLNDARIKVQS